MQIATQRIHTSFTLFVRKRWTESLITEVLENSNQNVETLHEDQGLEAQRSKILMPTSHSTKTTLLICRRSAPNRILLHRWTQLRINSEMFENLVRSYCKIQKFSIKRHAITAVDSTTLLNPEENSTNRFGRIVFQ